MLSAPYPGWAAFAGSRPRTSVPRVDQVLSAIGAALILGAFWALQTERMRAAQAGYQLINLVGAALLAASAIMTRSWAFIVLNVVWALVALWALARRRASRR